MVLEDGSGMALALENGGCAAMLGGGVGEWLKIAVAELGSSSGRRTCNNGIVWAKPLSVNVHSPGRELISVPSKPMEKNVSWGDTLFPSILLTWLLSGAKQHQSRELWLINILVF
jgi:hypothetical protein